MLLQYPKPDQHPCATLRTIQLQSGESKCRSEVLVMWTPAPPPPEKLIPKTLASGPLLNPVQCFFAARTLSPFFRQILQHESPHPVPSPQPWSYLCELSSVWEENAALLAGNRLISNLSTPVSLETMIQHSSCLWAHQPTDLTSAGDK